MFKNVQEKFVDTHDLIAYDGEAEQQIKRGAYTMANTNNLKYVDLVISEDKPPLHKRMRRQYRTCTLSTKRGQHYINLRVPDSVQDRILAAYAEGKTVRIFA